MESLWLRPGSGSAIPLDFLGPWPFCREDPAYEGLDFLGFSRQNRYFSMGYEAKSAAKFIARFFRDVEKRRSGSPRSWHMEAQDCSWGKLNLIPVFLQLIVVRAVPFGRFKQTRAQLSQPHEPAVPFLGCCDCNLSASQ